MNVNRRDVETDVLIIGGGSAGCLAGHRAREVDPALRVTIFEKGQIQYSGSIARGMDALNIVAVPGVTTPELYVESSSIACGQILDEPPSYVMAARSFDLLKKLESWGVIFPRDADGQYQMLKVHPKGKFLVAMKEPNLKLIVADRALRSGVSVLDRTMGVELLLEDGRVAGGLGLNTRTGDLVVCRAKAVILASGGVSRFGLPNSGYLYGTFDYPGNTGDGYILGFRAGAELTGFEHTVQAYLIKDINCPLLYITMTRGATLIDGFGQIMKEDHVSMGDLLMRHHEGKGPFSIRMRHLAEETIREIEDILFSTERPVQKRFFAGRGIDFRRNDVELHPTEFFMCGGHGMTGLVVNERAETSVPGLYAAGDVSCVSRGHLTGAFVFGEVAAESAAEYCRAAPRMTIEEAWVERWEREHMGTLAKSDRSVPIAELEYKVRRMINDYVVPPKNEYKLTQGLRWMRTLREDMGRVAAVTNSLEFSKFLEIRNIIDCGLLSARASLERKESRWGYFHYRTDYPEVNNAEWVKHVLLSIGEEETDIKVGLRDIVRRGTEG